MSEPAFDRAELLDAFLHDRALEGGDSDLADYHHRRYRAMAAAFGARLDTPPGDGPVTPPEWSDPKLFEADDPWQRARRELYELFTATVERLCRLESPFADHLEAPASVIAYRQRFASEIAAGLDGAGRPLRAMLEDLVGTIWGIGPGDRVSASALEDHGFSPSEPEPDPLDDW